MMNFNDTQTAFSHLTDDELRKAERLFRVLNLSASVKMGKLLVNCALRMNIPIEWAVKPLIYHYFVGGATLAESNNTVKKLEKFNVKGILDYSVEGGSSSIEETLAETLNAIVFAAHGRNIPFAVFKPTAFTSPALLEKKSAGIQLSECEITEIESFKLRIATLCHTAYENDIPLLIDAEDYVYQGFIDDVVISMMKKYNRDKAIVFNTLQMYRIDRTAWLENLYHNAEKENYFPGIKFVRGAYMEKERKRALDFGYPSPIYADKAATDAAFNNALRFAIEKIHRISIFNGTHNVESTQLLIELMQQHHISPSDNRVWFAQLYGMSDNISFNLAKAGYNVAKYIPYGPVKSVLPYLIRRADENTSIAGQSSRELLLIIRERQRRKNQIQDN
ncbi:MAG: proline dehydrogenase family protein [Lentimicrobiaceae bacterium]|nr:proline dehydrogenase family protein [Lentimicrobiaceae bacterium]